MEGGGGSSPHLECARPTDSSAFYLSLVLQICVRCQQWNPAAVIPRKKKKASSAETAVPCRPGNYASYLSFQPRPARN